jgi:hypothetical protein
VALVVALVARIAAGRDVEIGLAALGRGEDQRRGALLVEDFRRDELGPAAGRDLGAVGDGVLVHVPVEAVAVDVLAIGIERRRRRRVADAGAVVDLAGGRAVRLLPQDGAAVPVERHDVARPRGDEERVVGGAVDGDALEHDGRAVDITGHRDLEEPLERGDVGRGQRRLQAVVAEMLGRAAEL